MLNKKVVGIITSIILLLGLSGCSLDQDMILPTPFHPSKKAKQESTEQKTEANQQNVNVVGAAENVKVSDGTVVQRIPFPVMEYKSLSKTGNSTVKGTIYLKKSDGTKIYGKQTRLYLNPETSYSTQWYKASYLGGAKMSKVDSRLFNYLRFTTSDQNGNYSFYSVPSGSYYLIGVVRCGKECGYSKPRNIRIAKKISVFGSDSKNIDLYKTIR